MRVPGVADALPTTKLRGHYRSVCRFSAKVGGVGASPAEEKTVFLGAVTHNAKDDLWAVEMLLQGKPATLHIDTGAEVTVITEKVNSKKSGSVWI